MGWRRLLGGRSVRRGNETWLTGRWRFVHLRGPAGRLLWSRRRLRRCRRLGGLASAQREPCKATHCGPERDEGLTLVRADQEPLSGRGDEHDHLFGCGVMRKYGLTAL